MRTIKPDLTTTDDVSWQIAVSFCLQTHFLLDPVQVLHEWDIYHSCGVSIAD